MSIYQSIMWLAHRYNWHYAPPIYTDGDTQLWCKWCGFRQTIKFAARRAADGGEAQETCKSANAIDTARTGETK